MNRRHFIATLLGAPVAAALAVSPAVASGLHWVFPAASANEEARRKMSWLSAKISDWPQPIEPNGPLRIWRGDGILLTTD